MADTFAEDGQRSDVALPRSDAELCEIVREAYASGTALRIAGAGSWLDGGRPVEAQRMVSTRELSGVVEYVPGDLTITVHSGTPLAELERVTASEDQWISLDPFGSAEATIGASIATGSAGPLAGAMGRPRDVVLGLDAVLGQGELIKAGGRVVKNVAGFDLVRLLTGAWGTLGVITLVSLRLRARPEMDVTLAIPAEDGAAGLDALLARFRSLPVAPSAIELICPTLASRLGLPDGTLLLVRLMGSETAVRAQIDAAAAMGDVIDAPPNVWAELRASDPPSAPTIRWSASRMLLPRLWEAVRESGASLAGTHTHASVLTGVVRQVAGGEDSALLRAQWTTVSTRMAGESVTTVAERLPSELWPILSPSRVNDGLSTGIRMAFDPGRLLNPGILGDEPAEPGLHVVPSTTTRHA